VRSKFGIFLFVVLLCIVLIIVNEHLFQVSDGPDERPRINYKLLDGQGKSAMCSFTNNSEQTLYLNVTPYITSERPVLFTVFMNGKQIECLWNGDNDINYQTIIEPEQKKVIEVVLRDIPEGKNTFQFGTVYFPEKTTWEDPDKLMNSEYSMELTPFTIVSKKDTVSEDWSFPYHSYLFQNDATISQIVGIEGELCLSKDQPSVRCVNNLKDQKHLYYYWGNSEEEIVMVRFSLMKDWKQITWPDSGEMFLDIKANPGDSFVKEINLLQSAQLGANQYTVVAFVNPGVPFWDKNEKDLEYSEVNQNGARGWATLRNIIYK